MTESHGQQAVFQFSGQKQKSGSEEESSKKDKRKLTWAKGKPERKGARRSRRVESAGSKTVEKALKQSGKTKVATITFPIRLSVSEHAEWKEFATKNRFSLHQFIKNSVEDMLSRIRQGKSISWLKVG